MHSTARLLASHTKSARDVRQYLERQASDPYSRLAREHNYRARSAFKLMEIDDRFRLLKAGQCVLDVGAAPGSWSQVLVERVRPVFAAQQKANTSPLVARRFAALPKNAASTQPDGFVLAVDLQHFSPVPGATILPDADVTMPATRAELARILAKEGRPLDAVVSDAAPNPKGDSALDSLRIHALCESIARLAIPLNNDEQVLSTSSDFFFLCKLFDGVRRDEFANKLSLHFNQIRIVKPSASRDSSSELYILATGKKKHGSNVPPLPISFVCTNFDRLVNDDDYQMVWKELAKVAVAGAEALGRAFSRAVREQLKESQHAAQRHAAAGASSSSDASSSSKATNVKDQANINSRLGISLQESVQILNVREPLEPEQIARQYRHLFEANEKSKGGSLYLQAKVYRAKERLDEELRRQGKEPIESLESGENPPEKKTE